MVEAVCPTCLATFEKRNWKHLYCAPCGKRHALEWERQYREAHPRTVSEVQVMQREIVAGMMTTMDRVRLECREQREIVRQAKRRRAIGGQRRQYEAVPVVQRP